MRTWILAALWTLACLGCGDGTSVSFATSFGSVTAEPYCSGPRGRFGLQESEGLTVTVFVTENTTIVRANGSFGACNDITAGSPVRVRGREGDGRIDAQEVQVLGG
jgi:hypothetical protein